MSETKKRLLVHQDDEKLKQIIGDLSVWQKPLQNLNEKFEALGIGAFDMATFQFIKESGIGNILQVYQDSLEKQMEADGIKNDRLKAIALQGTEKEAAEFAQSVRDFKAVVPQPKGSHMYSPRAEVLTLEYITFEDGKMTVNDLNKERILERYCRIYISDDRETELHDLIQELAPLLDRYVKVVDKNKLPRSFYGGNIYDSFEHFFDFDRDTRKVTANNQNIKWAITFKNRGI